ncbi:NRPS-like enzyme [Cylindrobasidium torrendii FP15055 ss-10]|uniref:NRPS-like enzyme n=1 Tax=Cylindrobasidium torrendii FP15055 ss-10 TaxID=1314674 RepID=A0A0D7BJY7_9AGAR|nr:NRPS-like enzyme [Cylindrobasidium torrendii FP15055 ss-10]
MTVQGNNHPTFRVGPLDGSLNFAELFEYNAHHSPHHPWIRYAIEATPGKCHDITWGEGIKAIRSAAERASKAVNDLPSQPHVVGILAATDSITYITTTAGIMGSGNVPFPISSRNSPAAVAHLLKQTNISVLYVSNDPGSQTLAHLSLKELGENNVVLLSMPTYSELYHASNEAPPLKPAHRDPESAAMILHSSGTTRFPSPITLSNSYLVFGGLSHTFGEVDVCGLVISFHACPMFHMLGMYSLLGSTALGFIPALFAPCEGPPAPPTPARVLEGALATQTDFLISVPLFVEEYSKSARDIESVKKLRGLIYGGGPLAKHVGDIITSHGVTILSVYGGTEFWVSTMAYPKNMASEGWEWMRWSPHFTKYLVPFEGSDNIYRLAVGCKAGSAFKPAFFNSEIDGQPVYDTKDLILVHPTNPDLFQVHGRYDEQIMHSSGEKTNPVPIEAILCKNERIRGAIMFGRGKFQPGVLVIPAEGYKFDPDDEQALKDFRSNIWQTVELANEMAPQHSQLFKEMIIVEKPSKPIEYTVKGAPRRPATLQAYAQEIEALYEAVDRLSQARIALPESFEAASLRDAIANFVHDLVPHTSVPDDGDIFTHGADSLTATAIRNYIIGILKKAGVATSEIRALPGHFVFDHPTIEGLTELVFGLIRQYGGSAEGVDSDVAEIPNLLAPAHAGETIVKIHEGAPGERPLIVMHGGAGGLAEFSEWQTKFDTSVWGIQITPDAPLDSLQTLATFDVDRILEKQPSGPFKIAGYSASCALSVLVALELEKRGHEVERLIFLDTHPAYFAHVANVRGNPNPSEQTGPQALNSDMFVNMLKHDSSQNSARTVEQFFSSLTGTAVGEATAISRMVDGMAKFVRLTNTFVYELATGGDGVQSMDTVRRWVDSVKAPKTVYIAKQGLRTMPGDGEHEDLGDGDLGSRVVYVEGGHWEFLWNPEFLQDIQQPNL